MKKSFGMKLNEIEEKRKVFEEKEKNGLGPQDCEWDQFLLSSSFCFHLVRKLPPCAKQVCLAHCIDSANNISSQSGFFE